MLTAPLWLPLVVLRWVAWAALSLSRRVRGWYDSAWFARAPGDTGPDLVPGDHLTASRGKRLRLSKALPDVVEDPLQPAYRVRARGIHQPVWDFGPAFEARGVEVLEVGPGWHAFGPRGVQVLAMLEEARSVPLAAYRSFRLTPPEPRVILESLASLPLHREAERAALHVWHAISQDIAPGDLESGQMDHGCPVWIVGHDGWEKAIAAAQVAAIGIVLGMPDLDPNAGWKVLTAGSGEGSTEASVVGQGAAGPA